MMPVTDGRELRRAFGCFPTGVAALCGLVDGRPTGMALSSFNSVSLDPPLASVCLQNGSGTWRRLAAAGRLGVSILASHHVEACRRLAAPGEDRFAGIEWQASAEGAVFIEGAAAWLSCAVERRIPAGDHELVLLAIDAMKVEPGIDPLVFHASSYRHLARV